MRSRTLFIILGAFSGVLVSLLLGCQHDSDVVPMPTADAPFSPEPTMVATVETPIVPMQTPTSSAASPLSPLETPVSPAVTNRTYVPLVLRASPSPRVYVSAKKGVGLISGACPVKLTCEELQQLRVGWGFTWKPDLSPGWASCTDANGDPLELVGMIWGLQHLDRRRALQGTRSAWLLTFNEPDHHSQANMTPEVAATGWYTLEQYYPDKKLVSPGVTIDLAWLDRMRDAYIARYGTAPRFDALGVHCYPGTLGHCKQAVDYMSERLDRWGVDGGIWVNEYAIVAPADWSVAAYLDVVAEMAATTQWLEAHPDVARYAWFAPRYHGREWWAWSGDSRLLSCEAHELTLLGKAYAEVGGDE